MSLRRLPTFLFRVVVLASAVILVIVASSLAAALPRAGRASPQPVTQQADVRPAGPQIELPADFFGLSFEPTELLQFEQTGGLFDTALGLIRPRNGSALLMRIGGRIEDAAYWEDPAATRSAPRLFNLDSGWLGALTTLVRRDALRVILSVNLPVHSPAMAAAFAGAAWQALPAGTLAGVAIGNEPDLYRHQPSLSREHVATSSVSGNWPATYSMSRYRSDYIAYATAIRANVPNVRLIGPDSAFPSSRWVKVLSGLGALGPSMITAHRYAYSLAWPANGIAPAPAAFLSDDATAGLAASLSGELLAARTAHLPLRVSEINSLAGGGRDGTANTFATALWAPDVLFEFARAGVSGVNWHIRPGLLNAPFLIDHGQLRALPELYGLALFADMVGAHAMLQATAVQAPSGNRLTAWIVRSSRGLKVVLINRDGHADLATLRVPSAAGPAAVETLSGPSLGATHGVTLAGQSVDGEGHWTGHRSIAVVTAQNGAYRIPVAGDSAALVTLGRLG